MEKKMWLELRVAVRGEGGQKGVSMLGVSGRMGEMMKNS
jgi:hypothetical protein